MRRLLLLPAVAMMASLGSPLAAAQSPDAGLSPIAQRAFAQVAACTAQADALLVSVVVDASGSLRNTDPEDQRVAGILTAVDALVELQQSAAGEVDVHANLSVFDARATELVGWGSLQDGHADRLRRAAADQLPDRDSGRLTDYRVALRTAQSGLQQRARDVGGTSCKLVLWFTDGKLDVGSDSGAALAELCEPRGLLDGLRTDGVAVVALALFTESGRGSVSPADRQQLQAVAEGQSAGVRCGTAPIPADSAAGAYLRADDAGALRRLFAGAGALIAGATQGGSTACPSGRCPNGRLSFPVDAGIGGVQLIIDSPTASARPVLVEPSGKSTPLRAGASTIPAGGLEVTERDGLTTASLTFADPTGPQVGAWLVQVLDDAGRPTPAVVDLYYLWGARLQAAAPDGLVIGRSSPVEVALVDRDEQLLSAALYDSVKLEVAAGGKPVTTTVTADGRYRGEISLSGEQVTSSMPLNALAVAVTRPSGIRLSPISTSLDVATRLPPAYPTIEPGRLDLPALAGDGSSNGSLRVTGPKDGPTRACLADANLQGPRRAGVLRANADPRCIDVPAGETVDWRLSVTPAAAADGSVAGNLLVTLTPSDKSDDLSLTVPVTLSMTRPVDEATRWLIVLALMLAALAAPLIVMQIANWLQGRYSLGPMTRSASVPVRVDARGPRRLDHPQRPLLNPDDFSGLGFAEQTKKASFVAGGVTFARRLPKWPLKAPRAIALGGPTELVASHNGTDSTGGRAAVNFGLATSWVLVVDPATITQDTDHVTGRIVMVNEDAGQLREVIIARQEQLQMFGGWESVVSQIRAGALARQSTPPAMDAVQPLVEPTGPPPPPDGPPPPTRGSYDPPPPPEGFGGPPPASSSVGGDRDAGPPPASPAAWPSASDVPPPPPPRY